MVVHKYRIEPQNPPAEYTTGTGKTPAPDALGAPIALPRGAKIETAPGVEVRQDSGGKRGTDRPPVVPEVVNRGPIYKDVVLHDWKQTPNGGGRVQLVKRMQPYGVVLWYLVCSGPDLAQQQTFKTLDEAVAFCRDNYNVRLPSCTPGGVQAHERNTQKTAPKGRKDTMK